MTGVDDIDSLLFSGLNIEFNKIDQLKVASFSFGKLNEDVSFPRVEKDSDFFMPTLKHLMTFEGDSKRIFNLNSDLVDAYGETLAEEFFAPLLKKMTDLTLEELHPESLKYYGLSRIAIGSDSCSQKLKQISSIESKIAFYRDRPSAGTWLYPKNNAGIGAWITALVNSFPSTVDKHFGISLTNIHPDGVFDFSDGASIDAEKVFWTIPNLNSFSTGKVEKNPYSCSKEVTIFHYLLSNNYKTGSHYVYGHDHNVLPYRVTLYENFSGAVVNGQYRLSVQVVGSDANLDQKDVVEHLIKMDDIIEDDNLTLVGVSKLKNGFPVLLKDYNDDYQIKKVEDLSSRFKKITFCGRANMTKFFMKDVLIDVLEAVKRNT